MAVTGLVVRHADGAAAPLWRHISVLSSGSASPPLDRLPNGPGSSASVDPGRVDVRMAQVVLHLPQVAVLLIEPRPGRVPERVEVSGLDAQALAQRPELLIGPTGTIGEDVAAPASLAGLSGTPHLSHSEGSTPTTAQVHACTDSPRGDRAIDTLHHLQIAPIPTGHLNKGFDRNSVCRFFSERFRTYARLDLWASIPMFCAKTSPSSDAR